MPKLDLSSAIRIKGASGEIERLKGPGFSWVRPSAPPSDPFLAFLIAAFANAEEGGAYDPADLTTLWQDVAGTVPVTTDGQAVARVDDKSGRARHLLQATTAFRPLYRTAGGLHWIEGDGINDVMLSDSAYVVTEPHTWVAGLEHITGAGIGHNLFGTSPGATGGSTGADAAGIYQRSDVVQRISAARRIGAGSSALVDVNSAFVLGTPYVASARTEVGPDRLVSRSRGVEVAANTTWAGVGVAAPVRLFHGAATARMKFFGGVAINRILTTAENTELEALLRAKAGIP